MSNRPSIADILQISTNWIQEYCNKIIIARIAKILSFNIIPEQQEMIQHLCTDYYVMGFCVHQNLCRIACMWAGTCIHVEILLAQQILIKFRLSIIHREKAQEKAIDRN